jgi:uncharacterized membrane protein YkoI
MAKMLTRLPLAAAVAGLAMASVPALAAHHGGPAQHTKISMHQARQIALNAFHGGKIMKSELEHERGGSGLRYSFDMKQGTHWREVGVDARTGKVLENTAEGTNPPKD